MAYQQVKKPKVSVGAVRGWCLKYVDDTVNAPKRTATAEIAYSVERNAKRIKTSDLPDGVYVPIFFGFKSGQYKNLGHVAIALRKGKKVTIWDSESNSGARKTYSSINQLLAWFGAYKPYYRGWSTQCDGAVYAKKKTAQKPKFPLAGKTTAYVAKHNTYVRNAPKTSAKISGSKMTKKGKVFWAHSVVTGEMVNQNGVKSNKWLMSRWGNYTWAGNYRKK